MSVLVDSKISKRLHASILDLIGAKAPVKMSPPTNQHRHIKINEKYPNHDPPPWDRAGKHCTPCRASPLAHQDRRGRWDAAHLTLGKGQVPTAEYKH